MKLSPRLMKESARCAHNQRRGFVYFCGIVDGELIKIGFAKDVRARMQSIGKGIPVPIPVELLAQAPALVWDERAVHHLFFHLRHHGEWFRAAPELLAFIARVNRLGRLPIRGKAGINTPCAIRSAA